MTEQTIEQTSRRKKLLYIGLFTFQVLVVFWPLLMNDLIEQKRVNIDFGTMVAVETVWIIALIVTNIFFLREFTKKKWIMALVILAFVFSMGFNTAAHVVPAILHDMVLFNQINGLGLVLVLLNLIYTFKVAVTDIFRIKHDMIYSLIGAANIFCSSDPCLPLLWPY
jgi:hypothetical protein